MSDLDEFKATYFDECSELLTELEEQFTAIDEGDRDADRLNAVFRAIHSVKGGAGAFGFSGLVGFAHEFETLLDYVRNGKVDLTDEVVKLCIQSTDIVVDFVSAARAGEELADDYGAEEKARFVALCNGGADEDEDGEPLEEFDIDFVPVTVDLEAADAGPAVEKGWLVVFKPHRELYARANDPLLLIRELAELGEIDVQFVLGDVPVLTDFEPFGVYCHWEIRISGEDTTEEEVLEVFEFVDGDCDIAITAFEAEVSMPDNDDAAFDDDEMPSFADLAAEIKPKVVAAPPQK